MLGSDSSFLTLLVCPFIIITLATISYGTACGVDLATVNIVTHLETIWQDGSEGWWVVHKPKEVWWRRQALHGGDGVLPQLPRLEQAE
jgi:hypothetical protein